RRSEAATRLTRCPWFRQRNAGGNDHSAVWNSGYIPRRNFASRKRSGDAAWIGNSRNVATRRFGFGQNHREADRRLAAFARWLWFCVRWISKNAAPGGKSRSYLEKSPHLARCGDLVGRFRGNRPQQNFWPAAVPDLRFHDKH